MQHKYKCPISSNEIWYKHIGENNIHIENIIIDPKMPKSLFTLLRLSIDDLEDEDCRTVTQTITDDDWENIIKKDGKWSIAKVEYVCTSDMKLRKFYVIKCDIKDAVECVARGLGFDEDELYGNKQA